MLPKRSPRRALGPSQISDSPQSSFVVQGRHGVGAGVGSAVGPSVASAAHTQPDTLGRFGSLKLGQLDPKALSSVTNLQHVPAHDVAKGGTWQHVFTLILLGLHKLTS